MIKTVNNIYYTLCTIIFSVLFVFINIILVNRSSMSVSAALVMPVVYYALFKLFTLPTKSKFVNIQMITSGAALSLFGIEIAFISILIWGGDVEIYKLLIIAPLMNALAILFSVPMIKTIKQDTYTFPKGKITYELIRMVYDVKDKTKAMHSLALSVGVSTLVSLPSNMMRGTISPMLFGIGMVMNIKSAIILLAGGAYSLIILFTRYEMPGFSDHIQNPLIMHVAIGLLFGGVIHTMPPTINSIKDSLMKLLEGPKNTANNKIKYGNVAPLALICLLSSVVMPWLLSISVLIWLFVLLLGLILAIAVIKIRGETGMGLGISANILIPVIALLTSDMSTTLLLTGAMVLLTIQSANFLEAIKVTQLLQLEEKSTIKHYLIGAVIGSIIGILLLSLASRMFVFGSDSFPSPSALFWGTQAEIFMGSDMSLNPYLLIGSVVLGFALSLVKVSAFTLSVGILLPAVTVITMFLGSCANYYLKLRRKADTQVVSSGLILGEGVVMILRSF